MPINFCNEDSSLKAYNCIREEQCDDCFMKDHLMECSGCDFYDHEPVQNSSGLITVRPLQGKVFSAKKLMDRIVFGKDAKYYTK